MPCGEVGRVGVVRTVDHYPDVEPSFRPADENRSISFLCRVSSATWLSMFTLRGRLPQGFGLKNPLFVIGDRLFFRRAAIFKHLPRGSSGGRRNGARPGLGSPPKFAILSARLGVALFVRNLGLEQRHVARGGTDPSAWPSSGYTSRCLIFTGQIVIEAVDRVPAERRPSADHGCRCLRWSLPGCLSGSVVSSSWTPDCFEWVSNSIPCQRPSIPKDFSGTNWKWEEV